MQAWGFSSCETKETQKEAVEEEKKACYEYIDDQLPDLPWLKEIMGNYKKRIETGYLDHIRIYQCIYKNGIGFLLYYCVECLDVGASLINYEGKTLCFVDNGWYIDPRAKEFNIDYTNTRLIWDIQSDPPLTIENLYEQPLSLIQKCVEGKWKLQKIWDGYMNRHYYNTSVDISENSVVMSGSETIHDAFSYSWKRMEVSPPFPNINPYMTYVMWNDEQNRAECSFFHLRSDMLTVIKYDGSEEYTFIRMRELITRSE